MNWLFWIFFILKYKVAISNYFRKGIQIYNNRIQNYKNITDDGGIIRLKSISKNRLASVFFDGSVSIWNTTDWSLISRYDSYTYSSEFEQINDEVIASGNNDQIDLWFISNGSFIRKIGKNVDPSSLLLLCDGHLAIGEWNGNLTI